MGFYQPLFVFMRNFGISLLLISIPLFFAGVYGFTTRISSHFITELTKYCFMTWWLVGLGGIILLKLAKDSNDK